MDAAREEVYYTYKDYLKWPDYPRYELIDGLPYMMAGASAVHQEILLNLGSMFKTFLKDKTCKAYIAPFDVMLNDNDFDDTVVQPDLIVVCDKNKITKKGCEGVPDLVIEILSPSSGKKDKIIKFNRYRRAGVPEYWIVDPEGRMVNVHILNNGSYTTFPYDSGNKIPVHALPGCEIDLTDVFPPEEPAENEEVNVKPVTYL